MYIMGVSLFEIFSPPVYMNPCAGVYERMRVQRHMLQPYISLSRYVCPRCVLDSEL